jgi:hypothetical protein
MKRLLVTGLFVLAFFPVKNTQLTAQSAGPDSLQWRLGGYVKQLNGLFYVPDAGTYLQDQLWHHRLNVELRRGDRWRMEAGVRTRVFYGDIVKNTQHYGDLIREAGRDFVTLSANWVDRPQWVVNTTIDRLYVQYAADRWDLRLGRQRINWGLTNFWNPNDIFNAYQFTDFDYEERPGRDAVRWTYYTGTASSFELAATISDSLGRWSGAGLYKWNTRGYDVQVLAGVFEEHTVVGLGWAGAIGQVGFKGEGSLFSAWDDGSIDGVLSLEADYAFFSGWYVATGGLYQSTGSVDGSFSLLSDFRPSARFLYPFRWTVFGMARYPLSPISNVGLAVLYSPVESHAVFLNPSWTQSLAQNWDLDVVVQTIWSRDGAGYGADLAAGFVRVKYSY